MSYLIGSLLIRAQSGLRVEQLHLIVLGWELAIQEDDHAM